MVTSFVPTKEYLCVRNGEERGFTATEFKAAQAEGWEKQYQYKVGRKKEYMAPSEAEAEGYVMKPELESYTQIAGRIKEKSKERSTLLSEKKATPVINILKHHDLSRRVAELTEEPEELRSEKKQLLASLDYAEDTGLSTVKKDISAMEANLARLEQQEQKYTAELNAALAEYNELKIQSAGMSIVMKNSFL